jgi:peptidoglycan/LPS O-acetylase OafA/YrhL
MTRELQGRVSDHLNLIRGVAALLVVVGHVRGFFLRDYRDLAAPGLWDRAVYLLTGMGHQAVMVFFVLSGLLVGGSVLRGRWSWTGYISRRLVRLYMVLIPALLLTAVVDRLALRLPQADAYYFHSLPHFNDNPFVERMSTPTLVGNLFFLQTLVVPVYGSNSPLWSLAMEFWFYALFPLMVRLARGSTTERLWCAPLLALLWWWLPQGVWWGGLIWLMGVAVYVTPPLVLSQWTVWTVRGLASAVFALVLVLSRLQRLPWYGDYCLGLAFACWLYTLLCRPAEASGEGGGWYGRMAGVLAGCSYSTYAMHFPLVVLMRVALPGGVWDPAGWSYAAAAAIALLAGGAGYLFSTLTEAHTDATRRWASNWWTTRWTGRKVTV